MGSETLLLLSSYFDDSLCMIKVSERCAGDAEGAGVVPHLRLREHGGGGERGGPGGDHL